MASLSSAFKVICPERCMIYGTLNVSRQSYRSVRGFASSYRSTSDVLFSHNNTSYNNASIPFKLNEANLAFAKELMSRYPKQYKKAAVIPLLEVAQKQNKGWTSISVMNHVAELLEMPPMRVYEVATFYTMFNREPVGEHFVQICTTTPCMLGGCGSDKIVEAITSHLGINLGQTTADKKFTLLEVECLGACSNAPMIQVNDKFYEDLTPTTTIAILDALAAGKRHKTGPQSGRHSSEPLDRPTTLIAEPPTTAQIFLPEWQ